MDEFPGFLLDSAIQLRQYVLVQSAPRSIFLPGATSLSFRTVAVMNRLPSLTWRFCPSPLVCSNSPLLLGDNVSCSYGVTDG